MRRAQEGAVSMTVFSERVEVTSRTSTGPKAEQRTGGHHSQATPGIGRGSWNGEKLAYDGGDEDAKRNRGEDISRELQRIDGRKIRLNEAIVIKQAVLDGELGGDDQDLGNNDEPLDPGVARVGTGADGKVDAEQDERDEHPLDGEDLPEDGEGREEAGEVSRSADEDRNHVHDAEQEPGIPFERPGQDYPISEQEAECGKEEHQNNVDQPAGKRRRHRSMRHQPYVCHTGATGTIAIKDGNGLPRLSMKGLANQPGHAGEGDSVHGDDLVFSLHAGAARLGQWLHQKMGVVGVLKRRPSAIRIEEAVEDCSRASYIK